MRASLLLPPPLLALALSGCLPELPEGKSGEGATAGDCTDGADNDEDGTFDCEDDGCASAPDCVTAPAGPDGLVVAVTPELPADADDLRCVVVIEAVDPNGDAVTYRYAWAKDGEDAGLSSDMVAAALTTGGDAWTCTVTPTDGTLDGVPASATVTIAQENRAPGAPTVSITPIAPTDDDVLTCVIDTESVDPDGDPVTYAYAWTVDGVDAGVTGASVSASLTESGQRWTCAVTASDGDLTSAVASVSVDVTSGCGYALQFDGVGDYAIAADPAGLAPTSVTVSAWVRIDGPGGSSLGSGVAALWVKKSSAYDGQWMYGVGLSSDHYFAKAQNEYFVGDNMAFTFLYGSWTAPAVSTWFHVAQTYDAGSGVHTLYVNGAIVDSLAHGSGLYNAGSDDEFRLGSDNGTSGEAYFLHGSMDDVRVYSRALDMTEIQSSYAGSAPADSLAHWDFEEGSGRLAADRSGNGHDLALNGPTFAFECP